MTKLAEASRSVVVAVDPQTGFLKRVFNAERVIQRGLFLTEAANILGIPVLLTEQNPEKMGGADPRVVNVVSVLSPMLAKMTFSCCGSDLFMRHLARYPCSQVMLWGIETHICINQTAHELMEQGYQVHIAVDAVSACDREAHLIGLERMRHAGAVLTHTESIVYEWLKSAEHPQFQEILQLVKNAYASQQIHTT
jgi:nicotinamidase-related amidase